jgi:hypothetical protein
MPAISPTRSRLHCDELRRTGSRRRAPTRRSALRGSRPPAYRSGGSPAAGAVVLVREKDETARIGQRQHPVLAVVGVFRDAAARIDDRGEPAAGIVGVGDGAPEGVPGVGDPMAAVVRELEPAAVRRDNPGEGSCSFSDASFRSRLVTSSSTSCKAKRRWYRCEVACVVGHLQEMTRHAYQCVQLFRA